MEKREFSILPRHCSGCTTVLERMTPASYKELRRLGASRLRQARERHSLQPTALIHEAYRRLVDCDQKQGHSPVHLSRLAKARRHGCLTIGL